jgi:hypothetical protein
MGDGIHAGFHVSLSIFTMNQIREPSSQRKQKETSCFRIRSQRAGIRLGRFVTLPLFSPSASRCLDATPVERCSVDGH